MGGHDPARPADPRAACTRPSQAFDALPPGGALVVVERLLDDERRHSTYGLAQSLVMLQEFGAENAFDFSFRCAGWAARLIEFTEGYGR